MVTISYVAIQIGERIQRLTYHCEIHTLRKI